MSFEDAGLHVCTTTTARSPPIDMLSNRRMSEALTWQVDGFWSSVHRTMSSTAPMRAPILAAMLSGIKRCPEASDGSMKTDRGGKVNLNCLSTAMTTPTVSLLDEGRCAVACVAAPNSMIAAAGARKSKRTMESSLGERALENRTPKPGKGSICCFR